MIGGALSAPCEARRPNALVIHPDMLYVRVNGADGRAFAHAYPISCSDSWYVRSYPGGPTVSMPWAGVEAAMVSAAVQVALGGAG